MSKNMVIDADGHIIEDKEKLRSYLEAPHNRRGGSLVSAEPWDGHLQGTLPRNKEWSPHRPSANDWLRIMDKNNMEFAYLYSTSAGDVSGVREKDYAIALCRAYNNYVHDDFAKVSPRLKPLAIFPQQDPQEAAREIRRAVKELGLVGVSIKTTGLTLPLGHRFYDPIYEEAQSLGCLLGVHGTRKGTQELASGMFETFTEIQHRGIPSRHLSTVYKYSFSRRSRTVSETAYGFSRDWVHLVAVLARPNE
jgi:predicted TIM-barrel fold metal-dependent hydrolase